MADEVGKALTAPPDPRKQESFTPPPEVTKDPKFKQIGEWLKKPENAMTALVLVGSMAQDRRYGQSKGDAFFERALGTLGFRGELGRLNQADKDAAAKQQSEIDYRKGQTEIGREQVGVAREQVGATRENTAADKEAAMASLETQKQINQTNDETRRWIAQLQANTDASLAEIIHGQKNANINALLTEDDMKSATDLYKASLDSDNPMDFPTAVQQILRPKLAILALSGDPRIGALLTVMEQPQQAAAPTAAPGAPPAPTAGARPSANYTSIPQPAPAMGLPNPLLGQSVGQGPHTAPPTQRPMPPPMMYPGTK